MALDKQYLYDVVLSYAGEDRNYAEALANALRQRGVKVFYDQYEKPVLWGNDLYTHLDDIYQNRARYCVIFFSKHYTSKVWTKKELEAAQSRALRENNEYILPIRLDDTDIPGFPATISYINWRDETPEIIAELIVAKLNNKFPTAQSPQGQKNAQWGLIKHGLDPQDLENNAINDVAASTKDDRLKFSYYVNALKAFITSQDTTTPLTISVNGPWGSGKSSLMKMLKEQLEPPERSNWAVLWQGLAWHVGHIGPIPTLWLSKLALRLGQVKKLEVQNEQVELIAKRQPITPPFHPTIWFNAWKFSQEEQIWAALATEVLNQLKEKYPWPLRLIFWFKLAYKRATPMPAIWHVLRNLLPVLILAVVSATYSLYLLPHYQNQLPRAASIGEPLLWSATIISLIIKGIKSANPFKIPLKEIFDPPSYEVKIGFIGRFEADFKNIVEVITSLSFSKKAWESQKLVIFIDDLDRCRPLQAVNIIEAISLFLDSPRCVFIVGMDNTAVATSIEAKYKELVEKIRRETPGIVSPGNLFLDKIIQISFNIPRPSEQDINALVEELTRSKIQGLSERLSSKPSISPTDKLNTSHLPTNLKETQIDKTYFGRNDMQVAIKVACKLLKENPRQVKRFINLFRLKVYLADQFGILNGQDLTLLAILVAWSMQWPEIVRLILAEIYSSDICTFLEDVCKHIQKDGNWEMNIPAEEDQQVLTSSLDQVIDDLKKIRVKEKEFPVNWVFLPWEEWVRDNDFRYCIKQMEELWQQLQSGENTESPNMLNLTRLIKL